MVDHRALIGTAPDPRAQDPVDARITIERHPAIATVRNARVLLRGDIRSRGRRNPLFGIFGSALLIQAKRPADGQKPIRMGTVGSIRNLTLSRTFLRRFGCGVDRRVDGLEGACLPAVRDRDVIVAVVETRVEIRTVGHKAEDGPDEHADDDVVSVMILDPAGQRSVREGSKAFL